MAGVKAWIEEHIIPKSASSLRFACKAARARFNDQFTGYLAVLEDLYLNTLMNTHDANEGILSFLEKRKPEWKNV
jgi:cyclohexa-1,5-dienecarbonyl-CoA hydratase